MKFSVKYNIYQFIKGLINFVKDYWLMGFLIGVVIFVIYLCYNL